MLLIHYIRMRTVLLECTSQDLQAINSSNISTELAGLTLEGLMPVATYTTRNDAYT